MTFGGVSKTLITSGGVVSATPGRPASSQSGHWRRPLTRVGSCVSLTRSDHAGASAWKTTGADLREYEGQGRL